MMDADKTVQEQQKKVIGRPFEKGQSGNLKGRPKGARSKLSADFIKALAEDFKDNGASVIEAVRNERPSDYLRVVASLVPKEMHLKIDPLEEMTDDQLIARARELGHFLSIFGVDPNTGDAKETEGPETTQGVPPIH